MEKAGSYKKYFLGESKYINKSITELVSEEIADDIGILMGNYILIK